eukprot:TRINITY_DN19601_c0_g1_i1.p3 TRINITY_DN19601_c0_g1~~TRINITY_DN19601_c0_g1_i1.p3  ORF type:complete len:104 (+),score=10.52 TRINITY_DN19601_c0_g1_i1:126-437(+)
MMKSAAFMLVLAALVSIVICDHYHKCSLYKGATYQGEQLEPKQGFYTNNAKACQDQCYYRKSEGCKYFTWKKNSKYGKNRCFLFSYGSLSRDYSAVSGPACLN